MRYTKIIHFPLVSCVGRRALLLERVVRSGIASHFIVISLIDDLGPSYRTSPLRNSSSLSPPCEWKCRVHSKVHLFSQTKVQIITLCVQKSPWEWSSLLAVRTWGYHPFTWSMHGMAWSRPFVRQRWSWSETTGPRLCWQRKQRRRKNLLKGEKAWGQSLQPPRQRCCVFLSSFSLTPVPWAAASLGSDINCRQ